MRRILFASDFSKASRKAFTTALRTAKSSGATVNILHVLAPFVPIAPDQYIGPETWEEIDEQSRRWATKHLNALTEKAKAAGVRAKGSLVEGQPAREVTRFARKVRADLVIIGTHGRTGFAKLLNWPASLNSSRPSMIRLPQWEASKPISNRRAQPYHQEGCRLW